MFRTQAISKPGESVQRREIGGIGGIGDKALLRLGLSTQRRFSRAGGCLLDPIGRPCSGSGFLQSTDRQCPGRTRVRRAFGLSNRCWHVRYSLGGFPGSLTQPAWNGRRVSLCCRSRSAHGQWDERLVGQDSGCRDAARSYGMAARGERAYRAIACRPPAGGEMWRTKSPARNWRLAVDK